MNGKVRANPFLDIHKQDIVGEEQGLLSVAFHPKYKSNHKFYVDYTDTNGDTRVIEYKSDGNVAVRRCGSCSSSKQPYANHNGGQLQFGPDGWLYVGMGDGGSGGDPQNHAQDVSSSPRQASPHQRKLEEAGRAGCRLRASQSLEVLVRQARPATCTSATSARTLGGGRLHADSSSPGVENYGWHVYEGTTRYTANPATDRTSRDAA